MHANLKLGFHDSNWQADKLVGILKSKMVTEIKDGPEPWMEEGEDGRQSHLGRFNPQALLDKLN